MKALSIDSSSSQIIFSARNNSSFAEIRLDIGMHQSEQLLPSIDYVLKQVNLLPNDIDFTCLCAGPGSFTGLRLGYAALKAIELATGAPIYAIPTLEAIATPFLTWKGALIPVIDAKKDRFYASIYRCGKENVEPMDAELSKIISFLDPEENILVVGPDSSYFVQRIRDEYPHLTVNTFENHYTGAGSVLLEIGNKMFLNKEKGLQEYEGPVYIRPSEAEENLK